MGNKSLKENTFFITLILIRDIVKSTLQSIVLFAKNIIGKKTDPIKENKLFDVLNFFFQIGPRSFWKAPSGIKIGRSIGTFLHYIFKKESTFIEKKNK